MQSVIDRFDTVGVDAFLLVNGSNVRYVSGFTGSDSFVLLFKNEKYVITDYRYTEQVKKECPDFEVIEVDRDRTTHEKVMAKIIESNRVKRIGFESNHARYKMIALLKNELSDKTLVPTEGVIEAIRSIKEPDELESIKKAAEIGDKAFSQTCECIKVGMSEMELAWILEDALRENGSEGIAFSIIFLAGKNTSMPHGIPSRKTIQPGDFITMDFGAVVKGYRSDMTRTVIMGEPSEKQKEVYRIVQEAQMIGLSNTRSGISGREVNQIVSDFILKEGYAEFAGKGLGHGLGLDIHEIPFINKRCSESLKPNQTVTIEPGIYIPSWGGVRIEDTVKVTDKGCDIFTLSPKEMIVL